jgi:hypothetical protein
MGEEIMTAVEKWMEEISSGIDKIKENLQHVIHVQAEQATQITNIDIKATRAEETANEAKRMADDARCEVNTVSNAITRHVSSVECTMKEHEKKLKDACEVLYDQDLVMAKQTEILGNLRDSDIARVATEKEREKILSNNWSFLKWALPISVTTVTAVISGVIWFMVHYPILK